MIINNWYVAAESAQIDATPVGVRMLGCDFVLFRDDHGKVACLSDVCCHRGGSLSRGACVRGCVQCPYHGWEYAADGRVTRIPSLGDEARIPGRARIDSYPVEERYGLVWTFLGDLAADRRPQLPELLPEYGDEENWRMTRMVREWNVNWARLKENLADSSHLFLVHTFGKHLSETTEVWEVEETAWGIRIPQTYDAKPTDASKTAVNTPQAASGRERTELTIEISVIGMIQRNAQMMSSGYDQVIWNALTPVDATHTRHFNLHFRNFQREPAQDDAMLKTINWGFDEDAAVIGALKPPLTPVSSSAELLVATDGPENAYRDKVARMARELGMIDIRRLAELSLDRVLVIPSPARTGGGPWVHDTVPLLDA